MLIDLFQQRTWRKCWHDPWVPCSAVEVIVLGFIACSFTCLFLLCQCKTLHLNVQHHGQKDNISYEILKNHIFIFRRGRNGTANSVNIGFVMTWPDVLFNIPTFYDIPNIISVMPWWFVSAAASDQKKHRMHVVAIYAWLCLSCGNSGADISNSGCVL